MKLKKSEQKNKPIKFRSYRPSGRLNIGIIVFGLIFIYILGVSVKYFTTHNISTYQVSYGSIINDTEYTGFIIRDEEVCYTNDSGYIQFYNLEGSKVSVGNYTYTLSDYDFDLSSMDSETSELSTTDIQNIVTSIQSYNINYNATNFYKTYELSDDLNSIIQNSVLDEQLSELGDIVSNNSSIEIFTTDTVGIISYKIDGYEDITLDNFTSDIFDTTQYSSITISTGDNVSANASIYKLVQSEDWSILIELDDEDVEIFEENSKISLKFLSDNEVITAYVSVIEQNGHSYGLINLSSSMVRYITERYTKIEIILDELTGYKIPITSVVTRDFYEVPLEYITKGGTSSSNGVLIESSDGSVTFETTPIFYQTSEYAYIDATESLKYAKIIMEETSESMRLMETVELEGVYVVNKGYAEFKCVTILTESLEYYIVDDSMSYSISNFDYIALFGDSVDENTIIN